MLSEEERESKRARHHRETEQVKALEARGVKVNYPSVYEKQGLRLRLICRPFGHRWVPERRRPRDGHEMHQVRFVLDPE